MIETSTGLLIPESVIDEARSNLVARTATPSDITILSEALEMGFVLPAGEENFLASIAYRYSVSAFNEWLDQLYFFGIQTQEQQDFVRLACRYLSRKSEYVINGHENRMNYTSGTGHLYTVAVKANKTANDNMVNAAQDEIDEFYKYETWFLRQREFIRRRDRDGEVFLRFYPRAEDKSRLTLRFIEPMEVRTPPGNAEKNETFGIVTMPKDVETRVAYWINGEKELADVIQHRKRGVDSNVKRGIPLFWPAIETLEQVKNVRRNMAMGSKIQTSIAMCEDFEDASKDTLERVRNNKAEQIVPDQVTGKPRYIEHYGPGRIVRGNGKVNRHFPFANVKYSQYVEIIADNLRAVAALLNMPEFMLTSDASNANYSSTLVAEGPAVKTFEVLQAEEIAYDLEIMDRVLSMAVEAGRLPAEALEVLEVQVRGPDVRVRNRLEETNRRKILVESKVMSRQTWAAQEDLDFDEEQENIDAYEEEHPPPVMQPGLPGPPGQTPPGNRDQDDDERRPPTEETRMAAIRGALSEAHTPGEAIDVIASMFNEQRHTVPIERLEAAAALEAQSQRHEAELRRCNDAIASLRSALAEQRTPAPITIPAPAPAQVHLTIEPGAFAPQINIPDQPEPKSKRTLIVRDDNGLIKETIEQ
jgi:hypothetical protein